MSETNSACTEFSVRSPIRLARPNSALDLRYLAARLGGAARTRMHPIAKPREKESRHALTGLYHVDSIKYSGESAGLFVAEFLQSISKY